MLRAGLVGFSSGGKSTLFPLMASARGGATTLVDVAAHKNADALVVPGGDIINVRIAT